MKGVGKIFLVSMLILTLVAVPIVSASLFSDIIGKITGQSIADDEISAYAQFDYKKCRENTVVDEEYDGLIITSDTYYARKDLGSVNPSTGVFTGQKVISEDEVIIAEPGKTTTYKVGDYWYTNNLLRKIEKIRFFSENNPDNYVLLKDVKAPSRPAGTGAIHLPECDENNYLNQKVTYCLYNSAKGKMVDATEDKDLNQLRNIGYCEQGIIPKEKLVDFTSVNNLGTSTLDLASYDFDGRCDDFFEKSGQGLKAKTDVYWAANQQKFMVKNSEAGFSMNSRTSFKHNGQTYKLKDEIIYGKFKLKVVDIVYYNPTHNWNSVVFEILEVLPSCNGDVQISPQCVDNKIKFVESECSNCQTNGLQTVCKSEVVPVDYTFGCTDSDAKDYFIKGVATGIGQSSSYDECYVNAEEKELVDYLVGIESCDASSASGNYCGVVERFCDANGMNYDSEFKVCEFGCYNGACLPNVQSFLFTHKGTCAGVLNQMVDWETMGKNGEKISHLKDNQKVGNVMYSQGKEIINGNTESYIEAKIRMQSEDLSLGNDNSQLIQFVYFNNKAVDLKKHIEEKLDYYKKRNEYIWPAASGLDSDNCAKIKVKGEDVYACPGFYTMGQIGMPSENERTFLFVRENILVSMVARDGLFSDGFESKEYDSSTILKMMDMITNMPINQYITSDHQYNQGGERESDDKLLLEILISGCDEVVENVTANITSPAAKELSAKWQCSFEYESCPKSGIQIRNCIDLLGNYEPTTENINCSSGCFGCFVDGKCLGYGFRKGPDFCDYGTDKFVTQYAENAKCDNDFECVSNFCVDSSCVEAGLWRKIMNWFSKLFG